MKFYHHKLKIFVFLLIVFAGNAIGQDVSIATEDQIKEEIKLAPCNSGERLESVKKLFLKMGAKESDIASEKFKEGENLVIKKKGTSDETIVVGAHYDKVKEGCGAIDNWTGIVILANLYKTLLQFSTKKTYIFVAFDKEEAGLLGSKAMVKAIPKESYSQYCSMINMDSFGFANPQGADNMSNSKMMNLAKAVAKDVGIDFHDAAIANADADSSSFNAKKIPAITFHGLSNDWQKYLHSSNDKVENIKSSSVFIGYRFILSYLIKIDASGCSDFK